MVQPVKHVAQAHTNGHATPKPATKAGDTKYTTVNFMDNDPKKAHKLVKYNLPVGAEIRTSKDKYEVKLDGVYLKGKKVKEIDLPTFDMAALKAFANGDNQIDSNDLRNCQNAKPRKGALKETPNQLLEDKVNTNLRISGSDYRSLNNYNEGSVEGTYCTQNMFQSIVATSPYSTERKQFGIIIPPKKH